MARRALFDGALSELGQLPLQDPDSIGPSTVEASESLPILADASEASLKYKLVDLGDCVRAYLRSTGGPSRSGGDGSDCTGWIDVSPSGVNATVTGYSFPSSVDDPGDGNQGPVARHESEVGFFTGYVAGTTWTFGCTLKASSLTGFRNIISGAVTTAGSLYASDGTLFLEDGSTENCGITLSVDTLYTIVLVRTATNYRVYVNGILSYTSSLTPSGTPNIATSAYGGSGAPWAGDWWAIAIYDADKSSDIALLHEYLLEEATGPAEPETGIVELLPLLTDEIVAETEIPPTGYALVDLGSCVRAHLRSAGGPTRSGGSGSDCTGWQDVSLSGVDAIVLGYDQPSSVDDPGDGNLGPVARHETEIGFNTGYTTGATWTFGCTLKATALNDYRNIISTASGGFIALYALEGDLYLNDNYTVEAISTSLSVDTLYTVIVVRTATNYRIYLNGSLIHTSTLIPAGNGVLNTSGHEWYAYGWAGDWWAFVVYDDDKSSSVSTLHTLLLEEATGPTATENDADIDESLPLLIDTSIAKSVSNSSVEDALPQLVDEFICESNASAYVNETLPLLTDSVIADVKTNVYVVESLPQLEDSISVQLSAESEILELLPIPVDDAYISLTSSCSVAESLPLLTDSIAAELTSSCSVNESLPQLVDSVSVDLSSSCSLEESLPLLSDSIECDSSASAYIEETLPVLIDSISISSTKACFVEETLPVVTDNIECDINSSIDTSESLPQLTDNIVSYAISECDVSESLPSIADSISCDSDMNVNVEETLPQLIDAVELSSVSNCFIAESLPQLTDEVNCDSNSISHILESLPQLEDSIDVDLATNCYFHETLPLLSDNLSVKIIDNCYVNESLPQLVDSIFCGSELNTSIEESLPQLIDQISCDSDMNITIEESLPQIIDSVDVKLISSANVTESLPALTDAADAKSISVVSCTEELPSLEDEILGTSKNLLTSLETLPLLSDSLASKLIINSSANEELPQLIDNLFVRSVSDCDLEESLPTPADVVEVSCENDVHVEESLPQLIDSASLDVNASASISEQLPDFVDDITLATSNNIVAIEELPQLEDSIEVGDVESNITLSEYLPLLTDHISAARTIRTAQCSETLPMFEDTIVTAGIFTLQQMQEYLRSTLEQMGYTADRAAKLDNLDVAVSTRAETGLTPEQADQLLEVYRLMGLDSNHPLVVETTRRRVPADGSIIDQTITEASGVVTVERQ